MMLITMLGGCVIAQWAVYAIARDNRRDAAIALGVLAVFGVAVLNAQVYVYNTLGLDIRADGLRTLVYAITGTFLAALVAGIAVRRADGLPRAGRPLLGQGPRRHLVARPLLVLPHGGLRRRVVRHLRRSSRGR